MVEKKVKDTNATHRKPHGEDFADDAYDEEKHDLGPWSETPSSSRVGSYRYDYHNRAIQVTWRNQKNHGYIYRDVPYEVYRSFARASSKGKYINSTLNLYKYDLMDADEVQSPSNPDRNALSSRRRD